MMKKLKFLTFIFIATLTLFINVDKIKAADITNESTYYINEQIANNEIKDSDEESNIQINKGDVIKITSEYNIAGVYIMYEKESQLGTLKNNGEEIQVGTNDFLHEYIDLTKTKEFTIEYNEDVSISEIYVIDENECPSFIEKWEKPLDGNTDLLFFPTHSDDEVLYLLGVIPTYVARGAKVQVVYYTKHDEETIRYHELLHGLYELGIRNHPVLGVIPDQYAGNIDDAIWNLEEKGYTVDDCINYQVEMIRRFKPLVIVGHDENGEYGHGQHILNTDTLKKAILSANDPNYHIDSYNMYGIWDTPKTYLHLYKQNPIVLDFDTPLDFYNGKTAFEMSKQAFEMYKSQHFPVHFELLRGQNNDITSASQITFCPPTEYGLYRTTVGFDQNKNDMFENLSFRTNATEKEIVKEKIVIPELYNYITIALIIIAILLYFEISPKVIKEKFLKTKSLITKKNNKNNTKKNTSKKKSENPKKPSSNTVSETKTRKTSTTASKKSSNTSKSTTTKKTSSTTKKNTTTKTKK